MATTVLGLKTFAASDPVDYNEVNDNYNKIDNGVKTAFQGRAAHNWLDNSDFRNPVNQRGKNTYSDAGNEYTIDRWKTQYNTNISIENGYINIFGNWDLYQRIQNPKDGIYTFAARIRINSVGQNTPNIILYDGSSVANELLLDANTGEWKTYIFQHDLSSTTAETITFSLSPRGGNTTASISVEWAAMYKGSYTADTLPAYQPKGYAAELAECMRYYYQSNDSKQGQDGMIIRRAINIDGNTNSYSLESVDLPVQMRITPTITLYDDDGNVNVAKEWYTNDKVLNTSIRYANNRSFCVASESGGFVGGKSYFFQYAASADL